MCTRSKNKILNLPLKDLISEIFSNDRPYWKKKGKRKKKLKEGRAILAKIYLKRGH